MSIGTSGSIGVGPSTPFSQGKSFALRSSEPSKSEDVIAEFRKEARKTPMERLRDTILKRHNLSQEQFEALDPELKSAIQREIEEAMQRPLKGGKDGRAATGNHANVVV